MLSLFGSGIGRGIAIGKAYIIKSSEIDVQQYSIAAGKVAGEVRRFKGAVISTEQQYKIMLQKLPKDAPKESAAFINAHIMMLKDPLLVNESINIIRSQKVNAEHALSVQSANLVKVFEKMHDAYLRNKKTDVQHITNRLLRNLMGIVSHSLEEFHDQDLRGRIVISKDLSPAETMFIKQKNAIAFATGLGSQISHTAIVARSLRLPAVVGLHGSGKAIQENDILVVDGLRGIVLVNPEAGVLKQYKTLQKEIQQREEQLTTLTKRSSKTQNGERVKLLANIESVNDLKEVKKVNAAGVGLYRTEYLFMNRDSAPTEEEQFKAYKRIVTKLNKPVVIRTLDIGGDKHLDFNYPQKLSSESPLGLRAVRLCLNNIELFKPQLRAILRASAFGKVSMMIPMISNFDEVGQVLDIIKETKRELRLQKVAFDPRIKIGGMIEVPAAAIMADAFANKLDFLSIGTNDLIQYTLAIDRVDDAVNYLYDPIHPAVLQLIKGVIKAGERANIPVSLCGEMAGNVQYTRLLLGLGLKNFSMDATYLLAVKEKILSANTDKLNSHTKQILHTDDPSKAREKLAQLNAI